MFVEVQYNELKPRMLCVANEALVNGAPVAYTPATRKVAKATAVTKYVVTNAKNYDGINAVMEPTDAEHEAIASDSICIRVPLELGDVFATTEVTATGLAAGNYIGVSAGKYVKSTDATNLVYLGKYDNPWGLDMYEIEVIG